MPPRLFHVSETPCIARFDPRPSPAPRENGVDAECVWAVDEAHLRNYLFPRDCPRITYAAGPGTSAEDRQRFLGAASSAAAIEAGWLDRLRSARLGLYEFAPGSFVCSDPGAGYWISREAVTPIAETLVTDAPAALFDRGVELRLLQDFWPLCDAVAASTLEFSIIRKRNAAPRLPDTQP